MASPAASRGCADGICYDTKITCGTVNPEFTDSIIAQSFIEEQTSTEMSASVNRSKKLLDNGLLLPNPIKEGLPTTHSGRDLRPLRNAVQVS